MDQNIRRRGPVVRVLANIRPGDAPGGINNKHRWGGDAIPQQVEHAVSIGHGVIGIGQDRIVRLHDLMPSPARVTRLERPAPESRPCARGTGHTLLATRRVACGTGLRSARDKRPAPRMTCHDNRSGERPGRSPVARLKSGAVRRPEGFCKPFGSARETSSGVTYSANLSSVSGPTCRARTMPSASRNTVVGMPRTW